MRAQCALWLFSLIGWSFKGHVPQQKKCILIAAPHTSNWDFPIAILARTALNIKVNFLGKHQLFSAPWGWFFRALGGSPVDRTRKNNLVHTAVQEYHQRQEYRLALAPEGTRRPVTRWKMGFYHIAEQAQVPIICVGLDYRHKQIVFRDPILPSGNKQLDMQKILDFYQDIQGHFAQPLPKSLH